ADPDVAALGAGETRRKNVGAQHDILVGEAGRNGGEVGLRIRHEQVLRPRAVDGVAELPTAQCTATLRGRSVQAVETLPARCDGPDDHALSDGVEVLEALAELLDDADWLVPEDQTGLHRMLAADDVHVG